MTAALQPMTYQPPLATIVEPVLASVAEVTVKTRFGVVTAPADAVVEMPQGPLGFAQHRRFIVTDLPNPRLSQFKLLQSLGDAEVSFVVTEMSEGGLLAPEDLAEARTLAGIDSPDAAVLLIVTVRQVPNGSVALSVNLRAPMILDVAQRKARQVVLSNPIYSVRHPIEL
jgi:flagellar assembly factor FliW